MTNVGKQLKNALAEATFADADIEAATLNAIDKLDTELEEVGYEIGTKVEAALKRLEDALTTYDTSKENRQPLDAAPEDEDEDSDNPFAGLEG